MFDFSNLTEVVSDFANTNALADFAVIDLIVSLFSGLIEIFSSFSA